MHHCLAGTIFETTCKKILCVLNPLSLRHHSILLSFKFGGSRKRKRVRGSTEGFLFFFPVGYTENTVEARSFTEIYNFLCVALCILSVSLCYPFWLHGVLNYLCITVFVTRRTWWRHGVSRRFIIFSVLLCAFSVYLCVILFWLHGDHSGDREFH
ncbi:hypothetical protein EV194_109152 [Natronoflexus pectinivorans]|uniref:Uncharacterized protein n=1 Tax=Natronoflexus pectinivorans TaxID=682526 RepID=A0A4R2GGD1_9BACT|nr:hypothetical protein EV194_109152 [Natronoflexus pectinivorans]